MEDDRKKYPCAYAGAPTCFGDPYMASALGRRDQFHDVMVGIAPSTVKIVLELVKAISKSGDGRYRMSPMRIDERTRSGMVSTPPHFRGQNWKTFSGLYSLVMNTTQGGGIKGYTGSLAGNRSLR